MSPEVVRARLEILQRVLLDLQPHVKERRSFVAFSDAIHSYLLQEDR